MLTPLPVDPVAELATIGCVLLDHSVYHSVSASVSPEDFADENLGQLFQTAGELIDSQRPADVVTLGKFAPDRFNMEDVISAFEAVPTAANHQHYSAIVREMSQRRNLIRAAQKIIQDAEDGEDLAEVIADAEKEILSVRNGAHRKDDKDLIQVTRDLVKEIEERSQNPDQLTGLPTGLHDLDQHINGLERGDIVILAARPGMGKTAFALQIALETSLSTPTMFFSLEMRRDRLVGRLLSMLSSLNIQDVWSGRLSGNDWVDLSRAQADLAQRQLIIDDSGCQTTRSIASEARKQKAMGGLGLIVVDYLQLLSNRSKRNQANREEIISQMSRELKLLAMELDIPILVLSQLNRSCENRDDKRPRLSDLRESGSLEQDASVVLMLYRDNVYHPEQDNEHEADILIRKNRNGPIGVLETRFQKEINRFGL